jgi:two-component system CheB/CheR fusion protein
MKHIAYKVVGFYLIMSFAWIFFSDHLLLLVVKDVEVLSNLQTVKGIAYVCVIALMLFVMLQYHQKKEQELQKKEEMLLVQSKNAMMGEMIANITHQYRQPLSTIASNANLIIADIEFEQMDCKKFKQYASDILFQTKYLSQTITDFRDFFKPTKQIEMTLFSTFLDNIMKIVGKSLKNNNIEIEFKYEDTSIKTYVKELFQVMINLVNNAKDALVLRQIKPAHITITLLQNKENFIIEVCDNAGGVDKNIQDKIFDAYFSTKAHHQGTGLGLYMSKVIVQQHLKGILSVYNSENGACFTVQFPKELASQNLKS